MTENNITTYPVSADLTGIRFGLLVAIRFLDDGSHRWECQCDCGNITNVSKYRLAKGLALGCRCRRSEATARAKTTHGLSKHPLYRTWKSMRTRCNNPNARHYERYGGRGIKICERWDSFENFLSDMGEKPTDAHTLERRDNLGNYEPENCFWATAIEQNNNTRRNIYVTIKGETLTARQWARKVEMNYGTFISRIRRGWAPEDAIGLPPLGHGYTIDNRGPTAHTKLPKPPSPLTRH